MPEITSFAASEKVKTMLQEIPWGKRSKIINEILENHIDPHSLNPKEAAMRENPELPLNPKILPSSKPSSTDAKHAMPSSVPETILQKIFSNKQKTPIIKITS